MFELLAAGGPDGEVGVAILAKELFREVYTAVDVAHSRRRPEILACHTSASASNGRVENVHMLAEKIRRNAHGFVNHTNYRRRLIGRLGIKWATIPTRRIRGRQPHSAA